MKNLTIVSIGAGRHFVQENQPTAVGEPIRDWLILMGFADGEESASTKKQIRELSIDE